MKAVENYSQLINSIFGPDTTTFDISAEHSNNVIGALNCKDDFFEFKRNFVARLNRLKKIYETHPKYLKEIIVQVNEVASIKNWEGAFAELAAFDFMNQPILGNKTYMHTPIQPNITLDKSKSLAGLLGKQATNLDGFVVDTPLYFDIKCFKDNVSDILNNIYKDLQNHLGTTDFLITAGHALDISYDDFQSKRNELLNELKANVTLSTKPTSYNSQVITNLHYNILWGSGIQQTMRTYHPYAHAENFHKTIFNYANKFLRDEPNIIVLVVFPWYNQVVSNFVDSNIQLYRSLSRRVFCQYLHDATKFKTYNSAFNGEETIYEISQYLSGILFLEDKTILSEDSEVTNVQAYLYSNPNAKKPLAKSRAWNYLLSIQHSGFDDFEHDNY